MPDGSRISRDETLPSGPKAKLAKYLNIGIKSLYANVSCLQFGVASPAEILAQSVCEITDTSLKNAEDPAPRKRAGKAADAKAIPKEDEEIKDPLKNTIYDQRMGVIGAGQICKTCGNNYLVCPGHFGHITLPERVIHPKFFKHVLATLKCVCESCSACLITKESAELLGILKAKPLDRMGVMLQNHIPKVSMCPACKAPRAIYKGEKFAIKKKYKPKMPVVSVPTKKIYEILLKISEEDLEILGYNSYLSKNPAFRDERVMLEGGVTHRHQMRPEWMLIKVLPVLPPTARPYSIRDDEKYDDDLTDKYISILKVCKKLKEDRDHRKGKINNPKAVLTESKRQKLVADLEEHVRTLIDNRKGKSKVSGGRPHKGLTERMSSKEGRVRSHIQGKRVNFSARTVIDGDANLELDEIGMPLKIAEDLTIPEFVMAKNIDRLQMLVDSKKVKFIFRFGEQIYVQHATQNWTKSFPLKLLDVVERCLINGDFVLFNRQPTLRIESAMGFRVRVLREGNVFRMNLAVCTPYNADFDGDWFVFVLSPTGSRPQSCQKDSAGKTV